MLILGEMNLKKIRWYAGNSLLTDSSQSYLKISIWKICWRQLQAYGTDVCLLDDGKGNKII